MTNEKYVYIQDIKERKAAGRGVFGKRTGSKTRYVNLPQNHMTDAELKRRNSPVQTYNISVFIPTYDKFRLLPTDLKREYITKVMDNFNVNLSHIADAMHVATATLRQHLHVLGINVGRSGPRKPADNWQDFVDGLMNIRGEWILDEPKETCAAEPEPRTSMDDVLEQYIADKHLPDPEPVIEVKPVEITQPTLVAKPEVNPYRVTLSLNGTPAHLAEVIAVLTDSGTAYNFQLVIKAEEGGED